MVSSRHSGARPLLASPEPVTHEDGLHKARIGSILTRHLFCVPERGGPMGEVIPFPSRNVAEAAVGTIAMRHPPATVFHDRGWRILELPSSGQFLPVSSYCRRGIVVGRFAPQAAAQNHHEGTEIAILTRCAAHEKLSPCTIPCRNSLRPRPPAPR